MLISQNWLHLHTSRSETKCLKPSKTWFSTVLSSFLECSPKTVLCFSTHLKSPPTRGVSGKKTSKHQRQTTNPSFWNHRHFLHTSLCANERSWRKSSWFFSPGWCFQCFYRDSNPRQFVCPVTSRMIRGVGRGIFAKNFCRTPNILTSPHHHLTL